MSSTALSPVLDVLEELCPADQINGSAVERTVKFANLEELLPGNAKMDSSSMAIEDTTERAPMSHAELAAFIRNLDLSAFGLGPNDRVGTLVPNGAEAAVLMLCCFAACTVVPLNPTGTHAEVVLDCRAARAKVLLAHWDFIESGNLHLADAAAELGISLVSLVPDAEKVGRFALGMPGTVEGAVSPVAARTSRSSMAGARTSRSSMAGVRTSRSSRARPRLSQPSHHAAGSRVRASAEDISLILFTSGTSGNKKCVPYKLNTLIVGACCIISSWKLRPWDRVLNMMPLFHVSGVARNVLSPVLSGGSGCLCGSFDPILFWDIVQQRGDKISWYGAVPPMHQTILEEFKRRGLAHYKFRFIANAGGGLLPSLAREMRNAYGCTILPGYGMTECMPISAPPLDYALDREGTSGRSVGPELKIFDDKGNEVPAKTVGNVVVRGAPLFHGYEGNEEATREAFFEGGWFNTGDMGWMDEDGYLYITGRSKEVINRGGEIISPFEVEEALNTHPRVKAVIAFAAPHKVLEETVGVAVVGKEGEPRVSLGSLQQYCKKHLAFAKWPQVLVHMPDLPKNNANKPLRTKLATRLGLKEFWGGDMEDSMPETTRTFLAGCPPQGTPLTERIPKVQMLEVDVVALGSKLQEAGAALGVREAAAMMMGVDRRLAACVSPDTVDTESLLVRLRSAWDDWDVPRFILATPTLPRAGGGRIDEAHLEELLKAGASADYVGPDDETEETVQRIWEELLGKDGISVTDDFFEVGGTSLLLGALVQKLQEELDVRLAAVDLFNAPTIRDIAALADTRMDVRFSKAMSARQFSMGPRNSRIATLSSTSPAVLLVQMMPMFLIQPLLRIAHWVLYVFLLAHAARLADTKNILIIFVAVFATMFCMRIIRPLLFILAKWCIIGRYSEGQFPVFGSQYLKWWIVNQLKDIFGVGVFKSNMLLYYRLLGADIADGVKISKDTKLSEFDLLTIGPGVALDCAALKPFAMITNGCFELRAIQIGENSCVCAKSVIAGGAELPADTCVGPLSSSHELHDARPENRLLCRPLSRGPPLWLKMLCGWPILFIQDLLKRAPVILLIWHMGTQSFSADKFSSVLDALEYISTPERMLYLVAVAAVRTTTGPCLALAFAIVVKRCLIGVFKETPKNEEPDLSSWQLFRTWLMGCLIPDAHLHGVASLLGRHYEAISALYRAIGVKVGKSVYWPGSGFRFAEPDLVEIGDYVVFGSRSIVFTSDSSGRRQAVRIEAGSNVSDRCVLAPGTTVKAGAVLGSGALSKQGKVYEAGTYVGSSGNECKQIRRGVPTTPEESSYARAFTRRHEMPYTVLPEWCHIAWSTTCIMLAGIISRLPLLGSLFVAHFYYQDEWQDQDTSSVLLFVSLLMFFLFPVVLLIVLCIDLGGKWFIIGRRQPGSYAWDTNSYCQRWQLYLSLAPFRSCAARDGDFLGMLHGTPFLVWYFRMLGASIGKNVCLYPNGADPMMTEPELVSIGDGACIDDASLIAHLNTAGVFTLNRLEVGERCVMRCFSRLQQSAVMEPQSALMEHTLVLPADRVQANEWRQGWPAGRGRRWVPG